MSRAVSTVNPSLTVNPSPTATRSPVMEGGVNIAAAVAIPIVIILLILIVIGSTVIMVLVARHIQKRRTDTEMMRAECPGNNISGIMNHLL